MNPSIRAALLAAAFFLAAGARAEEAAFKVDAAAPDLKAAVLKYRAELQIVGFRFDDAEGELLSPRTHKPAPTKEVQEWIDKIKLERKQMALERIQELLARADPSKPVPADVADQIASIVKDTPDFPADVAKVLEGARVSPAGALRTEAMSAYIGLTRMLDSQSGWGERLGSALPTQGGWSRKAVLPGYQSDDERALGERMSRATIDYFSKYQSGRELLDRFRDGQGHVHLPEMMVLKVQDFAGAFYSSANRAMVCNFEPVKSAIIEFAPKDKRAALGAQLKTAKDLSDYLAKDPGAIEGFLEAYDVPLFHELTHAWQDKRGRLPAEQNRGNAPGNDPLEGEWEAFTNQNRFLHEKLLKDPNAAMKSDYFPMYEQMLANFDQFQDGITREYLQIMPAGVATLPDMRSLQREKIAATKTNMKRDLPSLARGLFKLIGLAHGSSAIEQAGDDYTARRDAFKNVELPKMRVEGGLAVAEASEKNGDWSKALSSAYQAELSVDAAPALKARVEAASDRIAQRALDQVRAGSGAVEERGTAVTLLAARRDRLKRGPEIPAELRVGAYLDVAEDYLRRAERATDPDAKKKLEAGAKAWVDALKDNADDLKDPRLAERLKGLRFQTAGARP